MDTANEVPIVRLVALLEAGERIEWDLVVELVADVPGWLQLAELLRHPNTLGRSMSSIHFTPSPETDLYYVSASMRKHLHSIFLPYAILLDTRATPRQRALRIKETLGQDPVAFAKRYLQDGIPEVVEAAKLVQDAVRSEETLLRGITAPNTSSEELLRVSGPGNVVPDGLLRAGDAPGTPNTKAQEPGWLQRLFSRRKG